jgi:hypothetical protein
LAGAVPWWPVDPSGPAQPGYVRGPCAHRCRAVQRRLGNFRGAWPSPRIVGLQDVVDLRGIGVTRDCGRCASQWIRGGIRSADQSGPDGGPAGPGRALQLPTACAGIEPFQVKKCGLHSPGLIAPATTDPWVCVPPGRGSVGVGTFLVPDGSGLKIFGAGIVNYQDGLYVAVDRFVKMLALCGKGDVVSSMQLDRGGR